MPLLKVSKREHRNRPPTISGFEGGFADAEPCHRCDVQTENHFPATIAGKGQSAL